nr:major tail protein [uncultured Blautia sp.]
MAFVGLRKPIIGKMTNETTYEKPEACGKAIGITVTPSYAEGSLYGDDVQVEYDKEFRYADVSLNTTDLPVTMHKAMFGRTSAAEEIVYDVDDEAGYVGLAWISVEKVDGVRKFVANFLPKVKFSEPAGEYATKGENIEYKTPTLTGRAIANAEGVWKKTKSHATEQEAMTTINTTYFGQS